jgi:hypothetical protein
MNAEAAASMAQDALIWLAGQPDLLGQFLAASGAGSGAGRADMRRLADDPEFLGFVLDFLLGSDDLLRSFAAEAGIAPDAPMRARAALPGGAVPDWT